MVPHLFPCLCVFSLFFIPFCDKQVEILLTVTHRYRGTTVIMPCFPPDTNHSRTIVKGIEMFKLTRYCAKK